MIKIDDYKDCEAVIRFFEEFSKIPHGSANTSMIADYLVDFAKSRGLDHSRDEADNVIIRKSATPGYENRPAVIFQGHLDMVAEKKPSTDIDMTKEGLTLYRDGDFLRAKDTTLGGDDGVAIAYALALLDSDSIPHPDFEAVFTSDEEIGLLGAVSINPDEIRGRLLINIDSDEEGVFTVGCAGGVRSDISLPVAYEATDKTKKAFAVRISGFKGGHSGVEIDKGRANAVKVLAETLNMSYHTDIQIAKISGGNADNAIPRECEALVIADADFPGKIKEAFERRKNMPAVMLDEDTKADTQNKLLCDVEPNNTLTVTEAQLPDLTLDNDSTGKLLSLLTLVPSGVIAMSKSLPGLVETSLNLGILRLTDTLDVSFSVRSAIGAEKKKLTARLSDIASKLGADYGERGEYPAWEYREESHLRDVMVEVYEKMYGKKPEVVTIHAGLECGIFSEKIEGLDCVSIGPDNFDIHTTEERLSLSSLDRVWKFLQQVIKEI